MTRRPKMTIEAALKVKRPTIRVGRRYPFYSTVVDARIHEHDGGLNDYPLYRSFTGQRVRVIEQTFKPGSEDWTPGESERLYLVRADDGSEFVAYRGELNGWFFDTGQFCGPSGKWGSER